MKTYLTTLLALLLCAGLSAQQPDSMKLYPDDPANGAQIFVYRPAGGGEKRPAVLIFPGGGYARLAMQHEGHMVAQCLVQEGFVAVIVQYRMPQGDHTIPLQDAEKAIATVRAKSGEWNLDPAKTGVIGFSAGGHLAASLSTLAADANRPSFAALFYPVISFDGAVTHGGSKKNLLGDRIDDPAYVERYSLDRQVNAKTPPTLLLLSDGDTGVVPANSVGYYTALKAQKIPAGMYIFPGGRHGWGFKPEFEYHEEMKHLFLKWLQEQTND